MMGFGEWQWHQLDRMQTICTSLQTDNHINTPITRFLQTGCSSRCPANSFEAVKAHEIEKLWLAPDISYTL